MSKSVANSSVSAFDRILARAEAHGVKPWNVRLLLVSADLNASSGAKNLQVLFDLKTALFSQRETLDHIKRSESASKDFELPEIVKSRVLMTFDHVNEKLSDFLNHMDTVLEKRERITNYLQTPFSSDYLLVEADHQAHFLEFFQSVSDLLITAPSTLSAMEWASHFESSDPVLERKLWSLCSMLAKCQRYHKALSGMGELFEELI